MNLPIPVAKGSVVLSPMAGFSDSPFRRICRRQGSALSITEFVATTELFHSSPRALKLLRYHEEERPIIFQIFGSNPHIIVQAAKRILVLNPDGIDLNMGCSTRKVFMSGSGAGLLREPKKVKEIISLLVKECKVPISAKIRLGYSQTERNYLQIAQILQEEGVWMVAVHGRTKDMGYSGLADWEAIGEIAIRLKIPVFGNGDVASYEEAQEKIKKYGVYGVYIGRKAMGCPWIFRKDFVEEEEKWQILWEHFCLMQEFYGESAAILFRKHWVRYLENLRLLPKQKEIARSLLNAVCLKTWQDTLLQLKSQGSSCLVY